MRTLLRRALPAIAAALIVLSCADSSAGLSRADRSGGGADVVDDERGAPGQNPKETVDDDKPKTYGYEVIARYPHDEKAYTQGLLIVDGKLFESTGRNGQSSVRLVDLKTGEVLKKRTVDLRYFAEGLASVGGLLYQATWEAGEVFIYDRTTLRPLSYSYRFKGEGWGLTTTPDNLLVLSDGTDVLRFMDPKGFAEKRRIKVTDQGRPVLKLNELEWIEGEIWANIWQTDRIARIDPETGKVLSWVDLKGILGKHKVKSKADDVLNGIAYDAATGNIYVTGKHWPTLFHIRVK